MFYKSNQGCAISIGSYAEVQPYMKTYQFSPTTTEEYQHKKGAIHKMDSYYGYDFGILHALKLNNDKFVTIHCGIYITKEHIFFLCEDAVYRKELESAMQKFAVDQMSLEHMVSMLINIILSDHLNMIEKMENELSHYDEDIINNRMKDFNQCTQNIRKRILFLIHYYEQLENFCEELLEDENNFFADREIHHLRIVSDRITRLNGNVHMLKDYMLSIREAWQTQMDMNLNHIMYIFTVVTTIFLPLTLIVGWYGMNFQQMPELTWKYGYISVIMISIIIVLICVWFLRKKKLLKK